VVGMSFMPGMGFPLVISSTISANVGGYGAPFSGLGRSASW